MVLWQVVEGPTKCEVFGCIYFVLRVCVYQVLVLICEEWGVACQVYCVQGSGEKNVQRVILLNLFVFFVGYDLLTSQITFFGFGCTVEFRMPVAFLLFFFLLLVIPKTCVSGSNRMEVCVHYSGGTAVSRSFR